MAVDELDTRILTLLLEQPRTSVREYARLLGVARGTLQARLDRMERDGVITGTGPVALPAALGHPVLAFVHIEVTQGHLDEVGDALAAVPEIIEAFSITGGGDLLTRVAARDNAPPGGRHPAAHQPPRGGADPYRGGAAGAGGAPGAAAGGLGRRRR